MVSITLFCRMILSKKSATFWDHTLASRCHAGGLAASQNPDPGPARRPPGARKSATGGLPNETDRSPEYDRFKMNRS